MNYPLDLALAFGIFWLGTWFAGMIVFLILLVVHDRLFMRDLFSMCPVLRMTIGLGQASKIEMEIEKAGDWRKPIFSELEDHFKKLLRELKEPSWYLLLSRQFKTLAKKYFKLNNIIGSFKYKDYWCKHFSYNRHVNYAVLAYREINSLIDDVLSETNQDIGPLFRLELILDITENLLFSDMNKDYAKKQLRCKLDKILRKNSSSSIRGHRWGQVFNFDIFS